MQATGVTARESAPTTNAAIRSKFLAAKSPAQQQQIFQLTAAISQQLAGWSGRAHIFRPIDTVMQTVALNFAAAAPFASATALLPTVQLCLWEFILDDLLDDERMPQAELEQMTRKRPASRRPSSGCWITNGRMVVGAAPCAMNMIGFSAPWRR